MTILQCIIICNSTKPIQMITSFSAILGKHPFHKTENNDMDKKGSVEPSYEYWSVYNFCRLVTRKKEIEKKVSKAIRAYCGKDVCI